MNPSVGTLSSLHSSVFMPNRLVKKLRGRKMTVKVVKIMTERFWLDASSVWMRDQRISSTCAWRCAIPSNFSYCDDIEKARLEFPPDYVELEGGK